MIHSVFNDTLGETIGEFLFTNSDHNYKNQLLEIAQAYFGVERPRYIHFDYGPHHAKVFRCICMFNQQMTSSVGRTKIEAEKLASQKMLNKLQQLNFKKVDTKWVFSTTDPLVVLSSPLLGLLDNLKDDPSFEVLSLYGDAVLRYVIAQYLHDHYSEFREGLLTLMIAEAMRQETRAQVTKNLKLESYVRTTITTRTLADVLSAIIGKIKLSALAHLTTAFILEHYQPFIDHAASIILSNLTVSNQQAITTSTIRTSIHNFKNELQEYAQRHEGLIPSYHLVSREGVDHAPTFTVECILNSFIKTGKGSTIKSADRGRMERLQGLIRPPMNEF
jgi:ribonuclease III